MLRAKGRCFVRPHDIDIEGHRLLLDWKPRQSVHAIGPWYVSNLRMAASFVEVELTRERANVLALERQQMVWLAKDRSRYLLRRVWKKAAWDLGETLKQ